MEYPFSSREEQLDVVGIFVMGDDNKYLDISISCYNKVRLPKERAEVSVYVNSGVVVTSKEVMSLGAIQRHFLDFDFEPGDKVEIDVNVEGKHATSVAVAVPRCETISVDTTLISRQAWYSEYACTVHFKDNEGETFFLPLYLDGVVEVKDGPFGEIKHSQRLDSISVYNRDSYLYEEVNLGMSDEVMDALGISHPNSDDYKGPFSDALFAGGEAYLEYYVKNRSFTRYHSGLYYEQEYIIPTLVFKIGTISKSLYYYKKNSLKISYWSRPELMTDPIILEDNISGGTGYFGLVTTSEYRMTLPEYKNGENIWH